jgi:hypothetical protein
LSIQGIDKAKEVAVAAPLSHHTSGNEPVGSYGLHLHLHTYSGNKRWKNLVPDHGLQSPK